MTLKGKGIETIRDQRKANQERLDHRVRLDPSLRRQSPLVHPKIQKAKQFSKYPHSVSTFDPVDEDL